MKNIESGETMKHTTKMLGAAWGILGLLTGGFYLIRPHKALADWATEHISIPVRETAALFCNLFPFSVAELLYTAVILLGLFLIIKTVSAVKKSDKKGKTLLLRLLAIGLIPATIITGYNWLWALGYYGTTFAERSGLKNNGVAVEDLKQVTAYFAELAAELAPQVKRDENGHFAEENFFLDTDGLYDVLEREFPCLQNHSLRAKPMLYSRFMSMIGFTGFYFPFTGEANVNVDFPPALQPETIAHELAHQRRVVSESEANFVSVAACLSSGKTVYEYSGALSGLTYLGNALYKADREAWREIRASLPEEIIIDWNDDIAYWEQFESPVETVATGVYDSYLKHNDQKLGIKSYGACVDLLVEYYKDKI